jgi:hypothetical protein
MGRYVVLSLILLLCWPVTRALGQEPIVYPSKGQSQAQIDKDTYQCYGWAKQKTGFDPMQAPQQPPQAATSKATPLRGAAGGAALGAVGGAVAGNAGKGAAIGAATGGVVGGVRMRRDRQREAQAAQQQSSAYAQARGGYNRAFSACMRGRGYSVE